MSLPDMLTAYANIISDQILNECDLDPPIDPAKYRVVRYHGHAIPDDMECSPHGILSVWWENLRPKNPTNGQCSAFPVVILNAKFVVCWKMADITSSKSITVHYTQNDSDAARLAWIAECVSRRLMDVACATVGSINEDDDPYAFAFLSLADRPTFLDCAPGGAQGGVAWLNWRIQAGIFEHTLESGVDSPMLLFRSADDGLTVGDVAP